MLSLQRQTLRKLNLHNQMQGLRASALQQELVSSDHSSQMTMSAPTRMQELHWTRMLLCWKYGEMQEMRLCCSLQALDQVGWQTQLAS